MKQFAELCQKSYEGGPGWTDVGDLRYGVFDGVLCFRGSVNTSNWIRNLTLMPAIHNGRLVHAGFLSAFASLADEVLPQIDPKNIIVTGHSLGAAIAILFAEHLGCPAVTFGCPRVYVRGCNLPVKDHTYIVCDDDPVPMVPRFIYQAFDNPVVLSDQDNEVINPEDHDIEVYIKRLDGLEQYAGNPGGYGAMTAA